MGYCTQADLEARVGTIELAQLTDPTAAQAVDAALVTAAIDEASSLIDSYVSGQYVTPLSPVPGIVKTWCVTIARRLLWRDRAQADGPVLVQYNEALAQIKDVAKGVAALPDSSGTEPTGSGGLVSVVAPSQVFTDDVLGAMPG